MPNTILNAPDLFNAAKGFAWTDLPRSSLPNLVDLFGRPPTPPSSSCGSCRRRYPAWLTPTEITKIQKDIAKLLGTVPPPTPPPTSTPSASAAPSDASPTPGPSQAPAAPPSGSAAPP